MKVVKRVFKYLGIVALLFFLFNAISIYHYSFEYVEKESDVAIVLGAGTTDGHLSPVFKERINHAIYLYENHFVKKIIFTGGKGKNQLTSDSQLAKNYTVEHGVPSKDILIEEISRYTYQNLTYAKLIMDSCFFTTALIVSDPIHMKRAMELAKAAKIECDPSPTKTTMYRSTAPKLTFLVYEAFFYTIGKVAFQH
jgi:uncharacterized SAM-binding protein YcdF (DUF218 family)